jgi:hypothetical protein
MNELKLNTPYEIDRMIDDVVKLFFENQHNQGNEGDLYHFHDTDQFESMKLKLYKYFNQNWS